MWPLIRSPDKYDMRDKRAANSASAGRCCLPASSNERLQYVSSVTTQPRRKANWCNELEISGAFADPSQLRLRQSHATLENGNCTRSCWARSLCF